MDKLTVLAQIRTRSHLVAPTLDERARRAVAAAEAFTLGRGGISLVARATGLARDTIRRGLQEQRGERPPAPPGRVRRAGGGRKPLAATDATLLTALDALVEPTTRGDPESPLRWTCKSVRQLAATLGMVHMCLTVC